MLKRGMFRSYSGLCRCHLRRRLFEKLENADNQPTRDRIRIKSWILEELQRRRKGRDWGLFVFLTPTMLLPLCCFHANRWLSLWIFISIAPLVSRPSVASGNPVQHHFNRPLEVHFSAQNHISPMLKHLPSTWHTRMSCASHACETVHLKSAVIFPQYMALLGEKTRNIFKAQ